MNNYEKPPCELVEIMAQNILLVSGLSAEESTNLGGEGEGGIIITPTALNSSVDVFGE